MDVEEKRCGGRITAGRQSLLQSGRSEISNNSGRLGVSRPGCMCDWIAEDPKDREAMRFPYQKEKP